MPEAAGLNGCIGTSTRSTTILGLRSLGRKRAIRLQGSPVNVSITDRGERLGAPLAGKDEAQCNKLIRAGCRSAVPRRLWECCAAGSAGVLCHTEGRGSGVCCTVGAALCSILTSAPAYPQSHGLTRVIAARTVFYWFSNVRIDPL